MFINDVFTPSRFEGKGEITLRGEKISYRSVSEDNVFYDHISGMGLRTFQSVL